MTIDELRRILEQLKPHFGGSIIESQESLKNVLEVLSDLVESLADAKVKTLSWKYYSETLVTKIIFTSHSILSLSNGFELKSRRKSINLNLMDYSSIYILTRALIENYATLCYIYNNELSDEERLFRFKLWEVSGLISRQNFISEEIDYKQIKHDEMITIDRIMNEIKKVPEYRTLDKVKLRKLSTYGLPRLASWQQLIADSNLKESLFRNCYSLFSNYAHSEYLSILQISQSSMNSKDGNNVSAVQLCLTVTKIIASMAINYYKSHFKAAELVYNTFPISILNVIEISRKIGEENTSP